MTALELSGALSKLEKTLIDFALKLTKDKADADDLFQETAYRAIKNVHQFKCDTNLKAWLMTIMRNTFINAYRQRRRRQTLHDGSKNQFLLNGTELVPNQGDLSVDLQELVDLVNSLDEDLRIPFLMAYQGYKYDEIAQHLGAPLGTIKSRIFFARKRLQKLVRLHYQERSAA